MERHSEELEQINVATGVPRKYLKIEDVLLDTAVWILTAFTVPTAIMHADGRIETSSRWTCTEAEELYNEVIQVRHDILSTCSVPK